MARLTSPLILDVAPTTGPLAGLRIFQDRVVMIDEVLRFEIVGIGRRPVLIQCRADLLISHFRIPLVVLVFVHGDWSLLRQAFSVKILDRRLFLTNRRLD